MREGEAIDVHMVHPGALDITARGRRDFSRFDPSPGEGRPQFSKSGPPVERRPFCEVKTFL